MKKQITSVLALILLLSALFGCSNALPQNAKTTTATSIITTQEATKKETAKKTEKKTETTAETAATKTTAKAKTTLKTTGAKTTTAKKETTTQKTTSKKQQKQKTTKAQNYCYITVECKSILNNMDKLKEGHEEFVPKNGIIISKTKCDFEDGESVYDVLKKTCNNKGVKLSSRNTTYGVYVSGINNLDEFDCGNQSGWVYTVNGSSPAFSCGKYTASNGDEIVFKYVC